MTDPAGLPPDLGALSDWAPQLARTFVALTSDIALVVDASGVIRSVAQGSTEPVAGAAHQWVGRPWIDTVSGETRPKIAKLLQEVADTGLARRREVNHPLQAGVNVPMAYTAVRLGAHGPVLAVGRDLRTIAAIQQRFIASQQDMERGYWQARQAESRYRLLFQVASDAVMVVDGASLRIVEANQAAAQLFDISAEHLPGRPASFGFERHSRSAVDELLMAARGSGQAGEIRARLLGTIRTASVAATAFRSEDCMRLLVRVRDVDADAAGTALATTLARLVDDARDGVVVTDSSGRILVANPAFVALVRAGGEAEVKGHALHDWLGLEDRPLADLVAQVRRKGLAPRVGSWLRPAGVAAVPIEVSATLLTEGDQECIGFVVRGRDAPPPGDTASPDTLQAELLQLGAQLGTLALPELGERARAITERHLLRLALQRAGGDRDAAAALLRISPDSLDARLAGTPPQASAPDTPKGAA